MRKNNLVGGHVWDPEPVRTASAAGVEVATRRFRVLGPIEADRDGTAAALGGPQQRRILAVLVSAAGRAVSVDRLVDAMWHDGAPDAARHTVKTYVSRLRTVLGETCVLTDGGGYRLDLADAAVDAVEFERLVDRARHAPSTQSVALLDEAVGLWRGDAYGEFASEWWALPEASRLEELLLVAHERRNEALMQIGEHARAVTELERLVHSHPLRSQFVEQLVRAYDRTGRHVEALRVLRVHRDYLAEETGMPLSPQLVELERSIVGGGGAAAASGQALRGYVLGDVIGSSLGASGVATVYRSVQPGLGRHVAVKVITATVSDSPQFIHRFELEAERVARLEHPHIVPLYDFWREPGGAYLVMRLMTGGTAEDAASDGPWSIPRVSRLVREVGGALAHAHAHDVIHGNLRAGNVLFDDAGTSYVADFGVGAAPAGPAPEQVEGGAGDEAGDQYALAALVRHLLGDSTNSNGTSLPGPVVAVLRRATADPPPERFPSVQAFVEAWNQATDGGDTREVQTWSSAEGANPFVGLRSFAEADASLFFGRDELANNLADTVASSPFLAVVGASGSGKSSLIHAGLVPRLRRAGVNVATMMPGGDPAVQLRVAVLSVATREPRRVDLTGFVAAVAAQCGGRLTIVIDQFEELWTITDAATRATFLSELGAVASQAVASDGLRLVLVVRADFYDRPLSDPVLGGLIADYSFPVPAMSAAGLHAAVNGPLAGTGVRFEPGLASLIVSESLELSAPLPLLQFTLAQLYERRDGDGCITAEAYRDLGGITGALAAQAESVYASMTDDERGAARRLMLRLVVPGDGADDTRRRVRHGELPADGAAVAARLEHERLLIGDRDPETREPTIEIAHESLLRSWPRLEGWLDDDRQVRQQLLHLGATARSWAANGRPDSELYRGVRLESAAEVLDDGPQRLTDDERDFVVASRVAANAELVRERAQRRRLRRLLTATAIALVVALVAGSIAFVARRQADQRAHEADVARLVSQSAALTSSKRDLAALLALSASQRDPGTVTDGALANAVYSDPSFIADLRHNPESGSVSISPDGSTMVTFGLGFDPIDESRLVRYDLATSEADVVPLPSEAPFAYPLATVDDRRVVYSQGEAGSPTPEVVVFDTRAGVVEATTTLPAAPIRLSVSPDGTQVAATTYGSREDSATVYVLDVDSLDVVASIDQPGPPYDGDLPRWVSASTWVDDDRIAIGSPSGRIMIWRVPTDDVELRLNDPPSSGRVAGELEVTVDGAILVAGSTEGDGVQAFDLTTGEAIWAETRPYNADMAIDERSGVVWAGERGAGTSRLVGLDLRTGERTGLIRDAQHGWPCGVEIDRPQRFLVFSSCNERSVSVWSLDGATAATAGFGPPGTFFSIGNWVDDGRVVIHEPGVGSFFVDVESGTRTPFPEDELGPTIFLRDGRRIRVEHGSERIVITMPDGTESSFDIELPGDQFAFLQEWSEQSGVLAVSGEGGDIVTLIDPFAGRTVGTIDTDVGGVLNMSMPADGSRLAVAGGDGNVEVYDVEQRTRIGRLESVGGSVTFSRDGRLLAIGSFNGTMGVFDGETLEPNGDRLTGGTAYPVRVEFSGDSSMLFSAGFDNTLRIWDMAARTQVGPAIAVIDPWFDVSPSGDEVAATTPAGVQRFTLDRDELRAAACRIAGRELTEDEARRFLGAQVGPLCS